MSERALRRYATAATALLALAAGCAPADGAPEPQWIELAALVEPRAREGLWRSFALEAHEWTPVGLPGVFGATVPSADGALPLARDVAPRLRFAERELTYVDGFDPRDVDPADPSTLGTPGTFVLESDLLLVLLEEGASPPSGVLLRCFDGERRRKGRSTLAVGELSGTGFLLDAARPDVRVPIGAGGERTLRFAASVAPWPEPGATADATLHLRFGGETIASIACAPEPAHHEVRLPAAPAERELRFELEGDGVVCGVHAPVVGPAQIGLPGARPWADARPDVVLFLADTFRADNLSFYGGEHDVTPNLDRFAGASLRFARAWAPAPWTLPSHASMMLGLHPYEHGATSNRRQPASELPYLADRLAECGYRTVAVTEAGFVSRSFGMDRGFEHFEERAHAGAERTTRRALELLGADDGRPVFLFVQTYHTHAPYSVSDAARAEHGARLGMREGWDELQEALIPGLRRMLVEDGAVGPQADERAVVFAALRRDDWYRAFNEIATAAGIEQLDPASRRGVMQRLRALYLGGVADLDAAFGRFIEALDARDRGARTHVVFTSDHGEHFGEHALFLHSVGAFEEVLRVPLLVRGPGIVPRVERFAASLVDVPATVCDLAGVAPDPRWRGTSLLGLEEDRPVYAFDCHPADPVAAAVDRELKLVYPLEGAALEHDAPRYVFDLERDPAEAENLAASMGAELGPRAAALADAVREVLEPRVAPAGAVLSDRQALEMRALGYAGEDDR